jgi:threonine dehydratase
VTDDAIAAAQATLWKSLRVVAEPGGGAAFAALASGAYKPQAGEHVAIILSGGNTAAVNFDLTR